jgi:hypothetical protein
MVAETTSYSNNVLAAFSADSIIIDNARSPSISISFITYQNERIPPLIPYVKCMHGKCISIRNKNEKHSTIQRTHQGDFRSIATRKEQLYNNRISHQVYYNHHDNIVKYTLNFHGSNDTDYTVIPYNKISVSPSLKNNGHVDIAPKMPCRRCSVESLCCIDG